MTTLVLHFTQKIKNWSASLIIIGHASELTDLENFGPSGPDWTTKTFQTGPNRAGPGPGLEKYQSILPE
jgi:hypothetical protein